MSKKLLPALVLGGFILLIISATFLFLQLKKEEITTQTPTSSSEINQIPQGQDDPIKKSTSLDGETIIYEIEGTLAGEFVRLGVLLKGELIIRGDTLERKIPLYVGAIDGTAPFGSYEGSFKGDSTWVKTSVGVIAGEVGLGEPIIILAEYPVTASQADLKTRKHEEILDTLIAEFKSKEFGYQIPVDFELAASRIGVIK